MKYACRDFRCIRGYIRPDKASLSGTRIFNPLITRHKTASNLQGRKPAVWLAVRSVCCQPVSPGFLRKFREKNRGKIARVQEPVCGSVQARNFLPDSCSCMECSCVEPACGRRAGQGCPWCRSRPCLRWRYRADRSGTCQSGHQPPASRHLSG